MARRRSLFGRRRRSKGAEGTAALIFVLLVVYVIQTLWPLLVLGAIVAAVWSGVAWRERERRLRALRIADVDRLSGPSFEAYLSRVFAHHGYGVELVGKAGDQGCDLLLRRDGRRIACQVKRYSRKVPNDAVAEAVAAKAFYGCDDAMVVTNSTFTRSARALARANGCELIGRSRLAEMILAYQQGA